MATLTEAQIIRVTNELMDLQKILAALGPSYSQIKEDLAVVIVDLKEARETLIRLEPIPAKIDDLLLKVNGTNGEESLPTRIRHLEISLASLKEELEMMKPKSTTELQKTKVTNRTKIILAIIGVLTTFGGTLLAAYLAAPH